MPLNLASLSFMVPKCMARFVTSKKKKMPATITAPEKKVNGKAEIKKVIDDFMAALCLKDVKAMLSHYAAGVIVFDVKPPFQVKGAVAWRHVWEACIGYFPAAFKTE